jgi:hypothetical protein
MGKNTRLHIADGSSLFDMHFWLKFNLGLSYRHIPSPQGFGLDAHAKGGPFSRAPSNITDNLAFKTNRRFYGMLLHRQQI